MASDSGDYTYPPDVAYYSALDEYLSRPDKAEGLRQFDLRSAADIHQAEQDRRLAALEDRVAHLEAAVHRLLNAKEEL